MLHTLSPSPIHPHTPFPYNLQRTLSGLRVPTPLHHLDQNRHGAPQTKTTLPFLDIDAPSAAFPTTASTAIDGRESYHAFKATGSRVLKIFNLPPNAAVYLSSSVFRQQPTRSMAHATGLADPLSRAAAPTNAHRHAIPTPHSMWTLREEYGGRPRGEEDAAWAVFRTHEEACSALALASPTVSIATALERDLEPFQKLRRFAIHLWPQQQQSSSNLTHDAQDHSEAVARSVDRAMPYKHAHRVGGSQPPHAVASLCHHPCHHPLPDYSLQSLPAVPTLDSLRVPGSSLTPSVRSDCSFDSSEYNLRTSYSTSDLHSRPLGTPHQYGGAYTLSSNPPNPRTTFRVGDWICTSSTCAAHNFGRNTVCIGCGSPRPPNTITANAGRSPLSPTGISPVTSSPSPRFHSNSLSGGSPYPRALPAYQGPPPVSPAPTAVSKAPLPNHPLLTPSGRALAIGGKVQNVSTDPLTPCIIWWPDNETLPEQGQIRPPAVSAIPQPPILNTGNRGPIEHQPGDWVCQKCDYLNWRRRKVCQTCFPYAEGNGDSISASIQAERVSLLSAVLAQHTALLPTPSPVAPRAQLPQLNTTSCLPPSPGLYERQPSSGAFGNIGSGRPSQVRSGTLPEPTTNRQQRLYQTGDSVRLTPSPPIYETSGHRTPPSPFTAQMKAALVADATPVPGDLLPSFLQDLAPPSLSPTSSSSAEFSAEEDDPSSPIYSTSGLGFYAQESHAARGSSGTLSNVSAASSSSSVNLGANGRSISNIWKIGGEETKAWPAVKTPSPKVMSALPRIN